MRRIRLFLFYLIWGIIYAGFYAQRGPLLPSDWERSSKVAYVALLVFGLAVFALPWVLRKMRAALGSWARVVVMWVPAFMLIVGMYFVAGVYYSSSRYYPFHPFLQNKPPSFDQISKEKPTRTTRILALGGSTTRSVSLTDADRYPAVLERILREQFPESRIEVLNGGTLWYTTEHALIYYAFYARDWNPDVVIFFEAINDLYRSCASPRWSVGEYKADYSHFYGPVINVYHPPSWEVYLARPIVKRWYGVLRAEPQPRDFPLDFFRSISVHERNTRMLVQMLRTDGKKVILATQGSLYHSGLSPEESRTLKFGREFCLRNNQYPSNASLERAMAQINENIRRIAREQAVPLADLDLALPKSREYFSDDVHHTAKGARLVATTIAETLMKSGYVH